MTKTKLMIFAEGVSTAHPTRMWELAKLLDPTRFEVFFATSKKYHPLLSSCSSIQKLELETISTDIFNQRLFHADFPYSSKELLDLILQDELLLKKYSPDVVISDFRLSALYSTKKFNIPLVNIIQFHWRPGFKKEMVIPFIKPVALLGRTLSKILQPFVKPFILNKQLHQLNQLQKLYNLKPFSNIFEFYCYGDYFLYPDLPSLFKDEPLNLNEGFVGPLFWKNTETPWPKEWPQSFKKPCVYISMGSTGQQEVIPKLLTFFKKENFEIILSTGNMTYPEELLKEVYYNSFIPADAAIQKADLVICNGGTSSTYHAISLGKPILAIPSNLDQNLHSFQLHQKYLAEIIHPDQLKTASLKQKTELLLNSAQVKKAISQAQSELHTLPQKELLNHFIEKIPLIKKTFLKN